MREKAPSAGAINRGSGTQGSHWVDPQFADQGFQENKEVTAIAWEEKKGRG